MINAMKSKKHVLALGCAALIGIAGTFAFFTDRVELGAKVTTNENSVDITPGPDYDGDLSAKWAAENAAALANYNPGDKINLGYSLENTGSKAVDVRETFVITSSEPLTAASPEYRLFESAIQDAAGAWEGNTVVSAEQVNANTIKYTIDPFVLSSEDEVVGANETAKDFTYALVFDKDAANKFQASTCQVDYVIEAKQHSADGPDNGWEEVDAATLTLGGQTVEAVPANN